MKAHLRSAWAIVVVASLLVSALLVLLGAWRLAAYSLLWGLGVGGLSYRYRLQVQGALERAGFVGFGTFAVIVVAISVAEESLCAGFGCALAVPNFAADLFAVSGMWLAWLSAWYYLIAPRYRLDYDEALLVASSAGVLFEIFGNGRLFADPVTALLSVPLVMVVYAGIVAIPLQLMHWTGKREGKGRFLVAFLVPYVVMLPVAVVIFAILALTGGLSP